MFPLFVIARIYGARVLLLLQSRLCNSDLKQLFQYTICCSYTAVRVSVVILHVENYDSRRTGLQSSSSCSQVSPPLISHKCVLSSIKHKVLGLCHRCWIAIWQMVQVTSTKWGRHTGDASLPCEGKAEL